MTTIRVWSVLLGLVLATSACSGGGGGSPDARDGGEAGNAADVGETAEKRCGEPGTYFSAYTAEAIAMLADCTILVGRFQQDSVMQLEDFGGLEKVRKIEGWLNVFRSGFVSLRGLDNLEVIEGNLSIHLNWKLESISALAKLHTITGNLYIANNDVLPQAEVEAFAARVMVGGTTMIRPMTAP